MTKTKKVSYNWAVVNSKTGKIMRVGSTRRQALYTSREQARMAARDLREKGKKAAVKQRPLNKPAGLVEQHIPSTMMNPSFVSFDI